MLIYIDDFCWLWAFSWILSLALALIIPARSIIIIIAHCWRVLQAHQDEVALKFAKESNGKVTQPQS